SIFSITAWGVGRCSRCGLDERSCNPANPSRRYRSTHFRTVRGQTPAASATASGVCPLSTCRTIRSRPRGVSRAFLCMFIRFSLWNLKLQQPQLPRSEPDEQPNESSQLAEPCRYHSTLTMFLKHWRAPAGTGQFGHRLCVGLDNFIRLFGVDLI